MTGFFTDPTPIGSMAGAAAVFLLAAAWMIIFGGAEIAAYAFPPLLIGMILAGMALAQLAVRKLIRGADGAPPT
jgi:hypothetical protein